MEAKFTVKLDKTVLDQAKQYERMTGTSLSTLIEAYLRELSLPAKEPLAEEFQGLFGSVDLPPYPQEKDIISRTREHKHKQ